MSVKPPEKFAKPPKPEEVLKYCAPTKDYACPIEANTVGIKFLNFKIRETKTGANIFDSDEHFAKMMEEQGGLFVPADPRKIRYTFDADMLISKEVGTTLVFSVGPQPVHNFRIIERHYFKDKVLQTFDFTFKFCIPNSVNSWECIYKLPTLTPKQIDEICANPYLVQSDSFYYINNGELIMHNKAEYAYVKKKK